MRRRDSGFTLVEVLIALVITALALTLGFTSVRTGARTVEHLEQSVLAGWVLDNALAEIRLSANSLQSGRKRTREKLLGREFQVEAEISRLEGTLPALKLVLRVADVAQPTQVLAEFNQQIFYAPLAR